MSKEEPVQLSEDVESGSRFLIYGTDAGVRVDLHYVGDALWVTQAQMAALFGRDVSVISRHIASILEEGELDDSNLQKMQIATSAKPVTLYNLDMIISVGYRVSSKQATLFRKWATDTLVQFATKGFVIDPVRLKNPDARDRVRELREIIRDIRSDEANVYRELRDICAMCQDYDGGSRLWQDFYRTTQAKLIYAVSSCTPSEIIAGRADAALPDMGLQSWPNDNIRKNDVGISKNYLAQGEVVELNRLTTILLDIFEDQLELGRIATMDQLTTVLDEQLQHLGRSVLQHGGTISASEAKKRAEREYAKYQAQQKAIRHGQADAAMAEIRAAGRKLPRTRGKRD